MDRPDRLELIARLQGYAAREAALEELKEQREGYFKNLGRHLVLGGQPADQREIDFKRGFWAGAIWAYGQFPKKAQGDLQKEIDRALAQKEGEDVGG